MVDIPPHESHDITLTNPEVGQVLVLRYQCEPGPDQPILKIKPLDDLIVREITHTEDVIDGVVHHAVTFRIERVGV
jgi:hypothetical protein